MSSNDSNAQNEELEALSCILDENVFELNRSTSKEEQTKGTFAIDVTLPDNFQIKPQPNVFHLVEHLPPVFLRFTLPQDYPSISAPTLEIEAIWMNGEQITILTEYLQKIWCDNKHEPILFLWYSTIGAECFQCLGIVNCLDLTLTFSLTNNPSEKSQLTSNQVATMILRHERERKLFLLHRSIITCPICINETYGSDCFSCYRCSNIACKSCVKSYLETLILEGKVNSITCPVDPSCSNELTPAQINSIVDKQTFQRYDRLLFQLSLESMDDIIYCPRCQKPVIITKNSENDLNNRLGECATCLFVFCTICGKGFHGVNPCQYSAEKLGQIYRQYREGTDEERKALEKQYGKIFNRLMDEMASIETIKTTARQCPKCLMFVDKLDGCNKMTCVKCHAYFCWLCLQQLSKTDPYGHFSNQTSPCFRKLFEGVTEMEFW